MKLPAPAAWVAIFVFLITVLGCGAMIYIAQSNHWSDIPSQPSAVEAEQ